MTTGWHGAPRDDMPGTGQPSPQQQPQVPGQAPPQNPPQGQPPPGVPGQVPPQNPPHGQPPQGQQMPVPQGQPQQYGPPGMAPQAGPPQPKKSKTGLVLGLVGGGLVVILLIGAGAFVVLRGGLGPEREINAAAEAGGLTKVDATPGESPVYPSIAAAVKFGDADTDSTVTAIYRSRDRGRVLFYGGTGNVGDPEEYLAKAKPATTRQAPTVTDSGEDTKETCGSYGPVPGQLVYCAWATSNSFGFMAPEQQRTTDDIGDMKTLMGEMRDDLQTTKS